MKDGGSRERPRDMAVWAGLARTVADFEDGGMGLPWRQPLEAGKDRERVLRYSLSRREAALPVP